MRKLVFSKHAVIRARERGIPERRAAEVISNAEETIDVRFGRKASYKKSGDVYTVVIYDEDVDKMTVVTILNVNKERLERYGFSRI